MKRFDPAREQKYIDSIADEYEHNYIAFSNRQREISNEMSNYGSTLLPTLISCGVVGCFGLSAYLFNKFKRQIQHDDVIQRSESPEITNQDLDEIPYTAEDYELQNY